MKIKIKSIKNKNNLIKNNYLSHYKNIIISYTYFKLEIHI